MARSEQRGHLNSTVIRHHSRTRGKMSSVLPASLMLGVSALAHAGPQGEQIVHGTGNVSRDSMTTNVHQGSKNLIVHWDSFNVSAKEKVNFLQPSASAAALNRIFDQNPSEIHGQIRANGRVVLINPRGVIFGKTASVDVASLVASGLDISNESFLSGQYRFAAEAGKSGGVVVNQGLLKAATGGSVSLLGGAVRNEGVIIAYAGQVTLAAGRRMALDFEGDGLLRFAVNEQVVRNASGLDDAVSNTGEIDASTGGSILLTGSVSRDVFSNVVNNSGLLKASSVQGDGGKIRLVAKGDDAHILNSGVVDVRSETGQGGTVDFAAPKITMAARAKVLASSGTGDGGAVGLIGSVRPGTVDSSRVVMQDNAAIDVSSTGRQGGSAIITADQVGLFDKSSVDASGGAGGGEIYVGGGFQGKDSTKHNSKITLVGEDALLKADATEQGDGGKIIVWSDDLTRFHGSLFARGAGAGNGGFAEVSGKGRLDLGRQSQMASRISLLGGVQGGAMGTLLLDPDTIVIKNSGPDIDDDGTGDDITNAADLDANTKKSGLDSIITTGAVEDLLETTD
ncbi:MAG: two-partner secretion domain-containing protein, partial [Candidatus Eutrophobiaceae bacterium]